MTYLPTQYLERIEAALDKHLPSADQSPQQLHEAMRYMTLSGGKRIRAMLVYACGEALGATLPSLDAPACAVEFIHAYSLIHDDLPAMDNDSLRRGMPTCHLAFDEATAILAGDSLHSLAFELLTTDEQSKVSASNRLQMVKVLAQAAGSRGMAGGQAKDLAAEGKKLGVKDLQKIHMDKTGALIRAAAQLGVLASDHSHDPVIVQAVDEYARQVGLAFQIIDDVLDEEADTVTLGKTSGADRALGKSTYPGAIGIDASRKMAIELCQGATNALKILDKPSSALVELAEFAVQRRK